MNIWRYFIKRISFNIIARNESWHMIRKDKYLDSVHNRFVTVCGQNVVMFKAFAIKMQTSKVLLGSFKLFALNFLVNSILILFFIESMRTTKVMPVELTRASIKHSLLLLFPVCLFYCISQERKLRIF